MSSEFYDAADYLNIPARASACVYADGRYWVTAAQAYARFSRVRWITVHGGSNAARYAGCLDWEKYNANYPDPAQMVAWAEGRRAMNCRARVYSDGSNLPGVWDAVGHLDNVVFWVALYEAPKASAEELAAAVAHLAPIPAGRVWAQQYAGDATGGVDNDVLFGAW